MKRLMNSKAQDEYKALRDLITEAYTRQNKRDFEETISISIGYVSEKDWSYFEGTDRSIDLSKVEKITKCEFRRRVKDHCRRYKMVLSLPYPSELKHVRKKSL